MLILFAKNWGENWTYFFFPENALCLASSRALLLHFVHVPVTYRLFIIISHVHKMKDQTSVTEGFTPTCAHLYVCSCTYTVYQGGQKMNIAANIKNKKQDSRIFYLKCMLVGYWSFLISGKASVVLPWVTEKIHFFVPAWEKWKKKPKKSWSKNSCQLADKHTQICRTNEAMATSRSSSYPKKTQKTKKLCQKLQWFKWD